MASRRIPQGAPKSGNAMSHRQTRRFDIEKAMECFGHVLCNEQHRLLKLVLQRKIEGRCKSGQQKILMTQKSTALVCTEVPLRSGLGFKKRDSYFLLSCLLQNKTAKLRPLSFDTRTILKAYQFKFDISSKTIRIFKDGTNPYLIKTSPTL